MASANSSIRKRSQFTKRVNRSHGQNRTEPRLAPSFGRLVYLSSTKTQMPEVVPVAGRRTPSTASRTRGPGNIDPGTSDAPDGLPCSRTTRGRGRVTRQKPVRARLAAPSGFAGVRPDSRLRCGFGAVAVGFSADGV